MGGGNHGARGGAPHPVGLCVLFLLGYLVYNIPIVVLPPYLHYLLSFQAVLELKPFWQAALTPVVISITSHTDKCSVSLGPEPPPAQ